MVMSVVRGIRLPTQWLLVLLMMIGIYLFFNILLPRLSLGFAATYLVQPLTWLALSYFILRCLPRQKNLGKMSLRQPLIKIAAGIALFQIYLYLVAGFFEVFGKSPNSFTAKGIAINLFFVAAGLIGMEVSRAWLINRRVRKEATCLPLFITLIYTVFGLSLNQVTRWGTSIEDVTKFIGNTLLPLFSENLMASFLALWGGVVPALVYRGILQGYNWFCPLLPDLNWAMKALVGTVPPIIGLVVVQQVCHAKLYPGKFKRDSGKGLMNWVVVCVAAVVIMWFSVGVFPVRPTVIISGSMRPVMEIGDMVIVGRVNETVLKKGDIIQFRQKEGTMPTVHRIESITKQNDKNLYITKGDNNRIKDSEPVLPEQVVGKVICIVPKAGWPTIVIKQLMAKITGAS
ncbi:MAG: signal peptidase I [Desulfotomaculaceae bacterium]|nr:signal peptidase I [Desulfotomaculaceae bacterium]